MTVEGRKLTLETALLGRGLPEGRRKLLTRVGEIAGRAGMPVYLVGGFVRDVLLGLAPDDFDLVVEGEAPRLAQAVARELGGAVTTHAPFGTATWAGPEGWDIDIATARTEIYLRPAALPQVKPADIASDLRRRDFTINAMALRLAPGGELLDPHGGQADLRAGRVRVLHPLSFQDDPTRLFRAVRYEQRLGFALAAETLVALLPGAWESLAALTGDRLRHELELIFREQRADAMLRRLAELDILRHIHPALHWGASESQKAALLGALPCAAWKLAAPPEPETLYLTLMLGGASPAEVEAVLARFNFNRAISEAVSAAVGLRLTGARPSEIVPQLDMLSEPAVVAAYALHEDLRPWLETYLADWRFVRAETSGDDLIALGLAPGPLFRTILQAVRAARLDGLVTDAAGEREVIRRLVNSQ